MKENQRRRTQMLFFKRLEIDGASIIVSQADKDLFKNFGTTENEEGEVDLESAMMQDHAGIRSYEDDLIAEAEKEEEADESKKYRDPTSIVEKIRIKRIKQVCAATRAVSNGTKKTGIGRQWTANGQRAMPKLDT